MSGITGKQTKIAFAKFATNSWGVAASVTRGMYFANDGGLKFDPTIIVDDAFGQLFEGATEVGDIKSPTPTLMQQARYDDGGYIWRACAMGSPAAVTISTSAAGQVTSWSHVLDLADVIDGLGITLAIDKVNYVEELTSAKISGFSMKNATGGIMQTSYKLVGSKPTIISSVNINSTTAGAVFPSLGNRIFRKHGVFRMNLNTAGALSASDAVKVDGIQFDFDRAQDSPQVFGQDYIDEPADNALPTLLITVNYPRMNTVSANSLYAGLRDSTAFKADLTFTGALINSTDAYRQLHQWPYIQLQSWEAQIQGPGLIKPKAVFKALLATTSPTGMAFVRPYRQSLLMTQSVVAF